MLTVRLVPREPVDAPGLNLPASLLSRLVELRPCFTGPGSSRSKAW